MGKEKKETDEGEERNTEGGKGQETKRRRKGEKEKKGQGVLGEDKRFSPPPLPERPGNTWANIRDCGFELQTAAVVPNGFNAFRKRPEGEISVSWEAGEIQESSEPQPQRGF